MAYAAVDVIIKDPLFLRFIGSFNLPYMGSVVPAVFIFVMFVRHYTRKSNE